MDFFLSNDFFGAGLSLALLLGYHLFLRHKLKQDPFYTIQAVNAAVRLAWVEMVMAASNRDVLAVQTLRNSIMGATFLSSTAVLLIVGILTLSAQSNNLDSAWHTLYSSGVVHPGLWLTKLLVLLLDMFIAFFSFAQAIRLFHHVGYMLNVPAATQRSHMPPSHVALHLNRAGSFYALGMRAYYVAVPLVFWLFGPSFMLLSTLLLIPVLFHLDRTPKALAADYNSGP